jgi:hypothetical protein
MPNTAYRINDPHVVSEDFGGEFVVLNLTNGTYYSLEGSGNLLWSLVTQGTPPEIIAEALAAAGNPHARSVSDFVDRLVALGLVRPDAEHVAGEWDPSSVLAIETPPAIEVFEDLSDLILADPIHDVEAERGWPAVRSA